MAKKLKSIIQYPCDDKGNIIGDVIEIYSSISKASSTTGIGETSISKCMNINHTQKKCIDAKGDYYRFFNDLDDNPANDPNSIIRYRQITEFDEETKTKTVTRYDNSTLHNKKLTKDDIKAYVDEVIKLCNFKGKFTLQSPIINTTSKALLLIDADRHVGHSEYDMNRFKNYIKWCLSLVKSGNYEEVIYVKLGDFYHTDTPFGMTTRGTQVGSPKIEESLKVLDEIIPLEIYFYEQLSDLVKTRIINTRGNHDMRTSDIVHRVLTYRFYNNKNIIFDMSTSEFKEFEWGIFKHYFSHGDNLGNRHPEIIAHFNKTLKPVENARVFLHTAHKHNFLTKNIGAGTWFQHPTSALKTDFEDRFGYLDDNRYNIAMEIDKTIGETNRFIHFIGKD